MIPARVYSTRTPMPVLDSTLLPVEKDTIVVTDRKNVAFPRVFLFIAAHAHTFRWLSHFLTEIEMYFQLLCALFVPSTYKLFPLAEERTRDENIVHRRRENEEKT